MGICSLPTQAEKELNAGESGNNIQERMRRTRRRKGEVLIESEEWKEPPFSAERNLGKK